MYVCISVRTPPDVEQQEDAADGPDGLGPGDVVKILKEAPRPIPLCTCVVKMVVSGGVVGGCGVVLVVRLRFGVGGDRPINISGWLAINLLSILLPLLLLLSIQHTQTAAAAAASPLPYPTLHPTEQGVNPTSHTYIRTRLTMAAAPDVCVSLASFFPLAR